MKKILLNLASVLLFSFGAAATDSPLWLRNCQISPNGEKIAFTYKGDIYVVSSKGGLAVRLTSHDAYDTTPVWSHDSKTIAYASDRTGNYDIWTVSAEGGRPVRVTTNSAAETPMSFSSDDKFILYTAALQKPALNSQFTSGWLTETYAVPVEGGRSKMVTSATVCSISLDADGKSFLYYDRKGSENVFRKHQVSSVARDIVYFDAAANTHTTLTTNVGEDRDPVYLPGRKELVFLSERNGGSQNVYRASVSDVENAVAVTSFKPYPVRFLSVADNGTLCYGYQGEIYTQKLDGKPSKVSIQIIDDKVYSVERRSFGLPSEPVMTPDGKQIAFSVRGEIFVTSDEYKTTKQITSTAASEGSPTISPDGKKLVYQSERDGYYALYMATMPREEEKEFAYATTIKETPLFPLDGIERSNPTFSPDGKELAYIEGRNILKVLNLSTKAVRQITDGTQHFSTTPGGFDYQWSPDGKWFAICYVPTGHNPYEDIGVVSASGDMKVHPITLTGYFCEGPKWVLGGNAILFASDMYGMRSHASWGSQNDVFIAFMNQDTYDKSRLSEEEYKRLKADEEQAKKKTADVKKDDKNSKKDGKKAEEAKPAEKSIEMDFDGVEKRIVRLTPFSSSLGDYALSKEGDALYFLSSFEDRGAIYKLGTRDGSVSKIKTLPTSRFSMNFDKDYKNLFLLGSSFQKTSTSGKGENIQFDATMELDHAAERKYMFDHVFLQESKRLFLQNHNGADFDQIKKDFEPFLEHIDNNRDFSDLLSEILGELNVSHSGSGARISRRNDADATAALGLFINQTWEKDGLLIDEVITGGPFDTKISKVAAGDVIESIDGVKITSDMDYYPLLNHKSGKKVLVGVYSPATGQRWEEIVKPISSGAEKTLLYERWKKHNAELVEKISGGRLGYVHIESMSDPSFRDIYADILGKYNQKEGIVIDTRFNGGGRMHEDIEVMFSGKKYFEQIIDGRPTCDMPSRRWNKPSIMVQGEANYSNAHGTPWVYKHTGIGKLVGMPVPGTMSSVTWETLQDPEVYFGLPVCGYRLEDGSFLENQQLEPDVKVKNTVESLERGEDLQLEAAVAELLKEIDGK